MTLSESPAHTACTPELHIRSSLPFRHPPYTPQGVVTKVGRYKQRENGFFFFELHNRKYLSINESHLISIPFQCGSLFSPLFPLVNST